jgi:RNA polymerase sigma factor (sigma-70 family)
MAGVVGTLRLSTVPYPVSAGFGPAERGGPVDKALVVLAMGGDHEAFTRLANASIGRLFAIARLILRETELAEDAVQEALVAAWRDLSGLRDPERFEAWLHRLLVRACYREARRSRRIGRLEARVTPIDMGEPDESGAIADRDQLERGFRRLEPDQRAILVLHFYSGLTLIEVADVLAIPIGTVKSRLHRATQRMRADLESEARSVAIHEGRPA